MVINKPKDTPRYVNYLSDFIITFAPFDLNGASLNFANTDFSLKFSMAGSNYTYTAMHRGSEFINCRLLDDGKIQVIFNSHPFNPGVLKCELSVILPDPSYPDGYKRVTMPIDTNVILTNDKSESGLVFEVEAKIAVLKGEKGEPFVYSDFTEEQIAELQRPATEVATALTEDYAELRANVDQAENARLSAEEQRIQSENQRSTAEALRIESELERASNEQERQSASEAIQQNYNELSEELMTAELARQNAEIARLQAELERERNANLLFNRFASDLDCGKVDVAEALTVQHVPTEASESLAQMAEKIRGLKLYVEGDHSAVDQSWGGKFDIQDPLNFLRNNQRADYPYSCCVVTPCVDIELKGADAYLTSDGYFTTEIGNYSFTCGQQGMVIYYFSNKHYYVPSYIPLIDEIVIYNGAPTWSAVGEIISVRDYSNDYEENDERIHILNSSKLKYAYLGFKDFSKVQLQTTDCLVYNFAYLKECGNLNLNFGGFCHKVYFPSLERIKGQVLGPGCNVRCVVMPNLTEICAGGGPIISNNTNGGKTFIMPKLRHVEGMLVYNSYGVPFYLPALTTIKNTYLSRARGFSIDAPNLTSIENGGICDNSETGGTRLFPSLSTLINSNLYNNCSGISVVELPELKVMCNSTLARYGGKVKYIYLPKLEVIDCNSDGCLISNNKLTSEGLIVTLTSLKFANCWITKDGSTGAGAGRIEIRLGSPVGGSMNLKIYTGGQPYAFFTIQPGFRSTLNASHATGFTVEELRALIANLADNTDGTALTITLGATNLAKLTAEDIAIAVAKNYTIN